MATDVEKRAELSVAQSGKDHMTGFLIIGGVGLVMLLVSLIFGEILDGVEGVFDGLEFGFDDFSTAAIGGFIGAFGFSGAIFLQLIDSVLLASVFGLVVGVLVAMSVVWLTRKLKFGRTAANISNSSMLGVDGRVISAIPKDGYGEVKMTVSGHILKLNAKASCPIPEGTRVWVSEVLSATSVKVEPIDQLEPESELEPELEPETSAESDPGSK